MGDGEKGHGVNRWMATTEVTLFIHRIRRRLLLFQPFELQLMTEEEWKPTGERDSAVRDGGMEMRRGNEKVWK